MLRLAWRLRPFIAAGAAVLIVVRGDTDVPVPDVRSLSVPAVAPAAAPQSGPGTLVTITPIRALDTRDGGPLGSGASDTVDVLPDGAAQGDVAAVVLSVAVAGATAPTHLTVGPTGSVPSGRVDVPDAAASGVVLTELGDGGSITVTNAAGDAHVVIDVVGYVIAA